MEGLTQDWNKEEKDSIVIMDFSGVYETEAFWRGKRNIWVKADNISGTNCYCDDSAAEEIRKRISGFSVRGIHFLDSGNYHYMSRFWIEKAKNPFQLLVLDNHTDMQPPAFGGILSCGGWIADALETLPNLKRVFLIGPDEEAWHQVSSSFQNRTEFFGREMLWKTYKEKKKEMLAVYLEQLDDSLPLYISLDKDILCTEAACTTWSQGDTTETELFSIMDEIFSVMKEKGIKFLGADICGEDSSGSKEDLERNDRINRNLIRYFKEKGVLNEE